MPERVKIAWDRFGVKNNLGDVKVGLTKLMEELQVWSSASFGIVKKELEKSRSQLEELLRMNADRREIRKVEDHMNEILYQEIGRAHV